MTTKTLTTSTTFDITHCGKCGGVYALTAPYVEHKRENGGYWHCPYCRTSWGYGESEIAELKRKLQDERRTKASLRGQLARSREEAEHEQHRANGYKGAMVRVKKRVAAGVCPNCNRTFQDLARHMKSKHAA